MKYANIPYEAFGEQGAFTRDARIIAELSVIEQRKTALREATQGVGRLLGMEAVQPIHYGEPVYAAFGMRRSEAKQHEHAELLLLLGESVPLTYCD